MATPPPLTPDALDDLVQTTLPLFKKRKWTDISLDKQNYCHPDMIRSMGVEERGGTKLSFRVQVRNMGNARNTQMYDEDRTVVKDIMIDGEVPWRKQTVNFSYDIDEAAFQSDEETIIDELKIRQYSAMNDMSDLQEENLWVAPTGPSDNRPLGITHWFQKDATTTPLGGLTGGNPSGFSGGCAGISSVEYPQYSNWAFGYTDPTTEDLVKNLKKAIAMTNFRAPNNHPELGYGKAEYKIYTTFRVTEPLERLAESRNDNLGSDLAKYIDGVTVGRVPMKWVSYLENNDTTDPLYGICWRDFRPFIKRGKNMVRMAPKPSARQHSVREVHWDNWMNYACYNRRTGFVGSTS